MLKGNKGEWSEIYVLLRLLGNKRLLPGDEYLQSDTKRYFPILNIFREDAGRKFIYSVDETTDEISIQCEDEITRIPCSVFIRQADRLLSQILDKKTGTFALPAIEQFMASIYCTSLKAKSTKKSDITIAVHDRRTGQQPILGFSIKSQLGSPATLLNASQATNFEYKIEGNLSTEDAQEINAIQTRSKMKDRISALHNKGCQLRFNCPTHKTFTNNLVLIDSRLPEILADIILDFFSESTNTSMVDLVDALDQRNPLMFDQSQSHNFYSYKVKRFLTDIALGMKPGTVWTGEYDATGGYLIVKKSGEIICYHIYNKNEFEDYLLRNTRLETPSSSKHKFGQIYEREGAFYFNLNLQIRFRK